MSQEILTLPNGYDRRKKPELLRFHKASEDDVNHFYSGQRVWFQANDGSAKQVTIKSKVRTWKKPSLTRKYTMEISVRYGLYEYDKWRNCGCGDDDFSRFLIPI